MQCTKYLTNYRLWFLLSFILFIPGWFIPIFPPVKRLSSASAATLIYEQFKYPSPDQHNWTFSFMLILLFAVPAISLGWVLQCLINWFLARRRTERAD